MIGLYYLFLISLYILIGYFVIRLLARIPEKKQNKVLMTGIALTVWLLIPTYDEIIGRIYLNHLCQTEAGVKVYQTTELPAEYWDGNGRAKFFSKYGYVDMKLLPAEFQWKHIGVPVVNSIIRISKSQWQLINTKSGDVLGEKISFTRYFGWINIFSPAPNVAEGCKIMSSSEEQRFFLKMFRPDGSGSLGDK